MDKKEFNIKRFAVGGGSAPTITVSRTYETDLNNIVTAVFYCITIIANSGYSLDINASDLTDNKGWAFQNGIAHGTGIEYATLFQYYESNISESISFTYNNNGTTTTETQNIVISEIGQTMPENGVEHTYESRFNLGTYYNFDIVEWIYDHEGYYKLSRVPRPSENDIINSGLMLEDNKEIIGWSTRVLSNKTFEELESVKLTKDTMWFYLNIDFEPYIGEKQSSTTNKSINGIWLNGKQPSGVFIGTKEIIKIIYNNQIIYEKGEDLIGPLTHAELSQYTHAELSNYTHAELEGPTQVQINKFYYNAGGSELTELSFEEGMTWGKFIASDYNTEAFYVSGDNICNQTGYNICKQDYTLVLTTDKIIKDATYEMDK